MFKALVFAFASLFCFAASAAELETYTRKYITVYADGAASQPPLHTALLAEMQRELPRFDYYDMPATGESLARFAQALYAYQQAHAGALAAQRTVPDLRFGSQLVSWAETQKIMESAYVLVPRWHFGALDLQHLHTPAQSRQWYVDLVSVLSLSLDIYQIQGGQAQLYTTLTDQWDVSEALPVGEMLDLADAANLLLQPLLLEALKNQPVYQELLKRDPAQQLGAQAHKVLAEASYAGLIKALKQQRAFGLKTQIESLGFERLGVSLPPGETALGLGVWLDQGYQIIEYRVEEGAEKGTEKAVAVGFGKVREIASTQFVLQPILAQREFELGDQLVEYPQTGIQVEVLGGTAAFGFAGQPSQTFAPQGGVRLAYSLARLWDLSELYVTLSGTVGLPLEASMARNDTHAESALAVPFTGEVGLIKRWFMRQWMLEVGLQGGILGGALLNTSEENTPTTLSPAGTALVGTGWQVNPDLLIGLQGGWRFSVPGTWQVSNDVGKVNLDLAGLSANGPVFQLYANYMF